MAGGIIIIRSVVRAASETDTVRDNLHHSKCKKLDAILAKQDEEWSDNEAHFLIRCLADAYDNAD